MIDLAHDQPRPAQADAGIAQRQAEEARREAQPQEGVDRPATDATDGEPALIDHVYQA